MLILYIIINLDLQFRINTTLWPINISLLGTWLVILDAVVGQMACSLIRRLYGVEGMDDWRRSKAVKTKKGQARQTGRRRSLCGLVSHDRSN